MVVMVVIEAAAAVAHAAAAETVDLDLSGNFPDPGHSLGDGCWQQQQAGSQRVWVLLA